MLCGPTRPGRKTCLKQLAYKLNEAVIGYKRFGKPHDFLIAIARLIIIRSSVRVRMLRDRLKYYKVDGFRDIDGTLNDRVTYRIGI